MRLHKPAPPSPLSTCGVWFCVIVLILSHLVLSYLNPILPLPRSFAIYHTCARDRVCVRNSTGRCDRDCAPRITLLYTTQVSPTVTNTYSAPLIRVFTKVLHADWWARHRQFNKWRGVALAPSVCTVHFAQIRRRPLSVVTSKRRTYTQELHSCMSRQKDVAC